MKIRSPIVTKLVARFVVTVLQLVLSTCRVEYHFFRPGHNAYDPDVSERFFFSIWHGSMIMPIFSKRARHMGVLVSRHQDGSILAESLKLRDVSTVRGSTTRGGSMAVRQLLRTKHNIHIAITPDGPKGPHRKMKSGIVFLASQTGKAIVPMAYTCTRAWRLRGKWTDTLLPKPFSKVFVFSDREIRVPARISRDELIHYTQVLQNSMDRINSIAEQFASGDEQASAESKAAA